MYPREGRFLQEKCERCRWDEEVMALEVAHLRMPGGVFFGGGEEIEKHWDHHELSLCPNCHRALDFRTQRIYG